MLDSISFVYSEQTVKWFMPEDKNSLIQDTTYTSIFICWPPLSLSLSCTHAHTQYSSPYWLTKKWYETLPRFLLTLSSTPNTLCTLNISNTNFICHLVFFKFAVHLTCDYTPNGAVFDQITNKSRVKWYLRLTDFNQNLPVRSTEHIYLNFWICLLYIF